MIMLKYWLFLVVLAILKYLLDRSTTHSVRACGEDRQQCFDSEGTSPWQVVWAED